MTRILDDIEAEKEYVIGETSVTYNQTFSSMAHLLGATVKRETEDAGWIYDYKIIRVI